jgi:hypothetical protein
MPRNINCIHVESQYYCKHPRGPMVCVCVKNFSERCDMQEMNPRPAPPPPCPIPSFDSRTNFDIIINALRAQDHFLNLSTPITKKDKRDLKKLFDKAIAECKLHYGY